MCTDESRVTSDIGKPQVEGYTPPSLCKGIASVDTALY